MFDIIVTLVPCLSKQQANSLKVRTLLMLTLSLKQTCRAEWMVFAKGNTVTNPISISENR